MAEVKEEKVLEQEPSKDTQKEEGKMVTLRDIEILKHTVFTEKSQKLMHENNVLTVSVNKGVKKSEIKHAVSAFFNVKVDKVCVLNTKSKEKRVGRFVGKVSGMRKAYCYVNKANNLLEAANEAQAELQNK